MRGGPSSDPSPSGARRTPCGWSSWTRAGPVSASSIRTAFGRKMAMSSLIFRSSSGEIDELPPKTCVFRRGSDPLRRGSASKIDPLISNLFGCLLWREAGGGDADCGDSGSDTTGAFRSRQDDPGDRCDLKLSRNTVRKVLRSAETAFSYGREVEPRPKLGRWNGRPRSATGEERGGADARAVDADPDFRGAARVRL